MKKGILIKYGEIVLKGKNRAVFENILMKDIRAGLKELGQIDLKKEQGRFYLPVPEDDDGEWIDRAIELLQHVFGIIGICPVDVPESDDLETIGDAMVAYVKREFDRPCTFKVFAKRADKKYPYNSLQIAAKLGERVLHETDGWTVDVHQPQVKLYAEIRNQVYVYGKEIKGLGGLPVGTGGKATLLLSGGIDSPVAGWMMAKRGVQLSAVYFHAHPYTSDRARDKVLELARRVSKYAGPIPVYVVPFTRIQLDIYAKCQHEKLTIIMRRFMMRIAEKIARRTACGALITGESLGQVASQTMRSLECTNAVCTLPVFRPLIGFDKEDIVTVSKKIGTYDTSILPYEDCCTIFVAKHPVTKPILDVIERHEHHLDDIIEEMVDKALETDEIIIVDAEGKRVLKYREDPLTEGM